MIFIVRPLEELEQLKVVRSYDPPAIPDYIREGLKRLIPAGVLKWNWRKGRWELWQRLWGSSTQLFPQPLVRWCDSDNRPLPLSESFLDHVRMSLKKGHEGNVQVLQEMEVANEKFQQDVTVQHAQKTAADVMKKYDLSSNKLGGCRLSMRTPQEI